MIVIGGKILTSVLVGGPNLLLAYKILIRPHIHTIFNLSLAFLFCIFGIFGPILYWCTLDIVSEVIDGVFDNKIECSRYLEVNHLLAEALKIITSNIMFRFFYIVYAGRGLVLNGMHDNRLFKICFTILTLALSISSYLSFRIDKARNELYPQNTVVGQICLNMKLDSKKDEKTQLLMAAYILSFGSLYAYLVRRVKKFIPKMCISNNSHACLGGRFRRNIITFDEISAWFFFIIIQFVVANCLIFLLSNVQDTITQGGVFAIYIGYVTLYNTVNLVIIPISILYRSRRNYPVIWSNYVVNEYKFFSNFKPVIRGRQAVSQDEESASTLVVADEQLTSIDTTIDMELPTPTCSGYLPNNSSNRVCAHQLTCLPSRRPRNDLPPVEI